MRYLLVYSVVSGESENISSQPFLPFLVKLRLNLKPLNNLLHSGSVLRGGSLSAIMTILLLIPSCGYNLNLLSGATFEIPDRSFAFSVSMAGLELELIKQF